MNGSDDPKVTGPSQWQRREAKELVKNPEGESPKSGSDEAPPSRSLLLQNASKFLENDDIRGSSTDRKVAFLESKGLTSEEIQNLLGVSRVPEISSQSPSSSEHKVATSPSNPSQTESSIPRQAETPRDIPPIITYPEFLLHSQKPPPLITANRLLTTLYLASGAAATVYGTNKYLVTPMLESLNTARHSLFETTSNNLSTLNTKLEKVVSVIPEHHNTDSSILKQNSEEEGADDVSSITSDPTELFHRDTATQTSPLPSRRPSTANNSTTSLPTSSPLTTPLGIQSSHLKTINSHLSELLSDDNTSGDTYERVRDRLNDLQTYLEGIEFGIPTYTSGWDDRSKSGDEIANLKAEIRGVKGVLLSARTFPGGGTRGKVAG